MDLTWKAIHADLRSKMPDVEITVAEIREADEFIRDGRGWVAIEGAETFANGQVAVRVQHTPDGGIGDRIWDDAAQKLSVRRA